MFDFTKMAELPAVAASIDTALSSTAERLTEISEQLNLLIITTAIAALPMDERSPENIEDVLTQANIYYLNHRSKMHRDAVVIRDHETTMQMEP